MTKKMVFRKSIFTFLAILANSLYAQIEPVHTTLTMENGLPSNEVYCIIQGPQDNIWMGTDRGLVKYNGNEIVTYTTEDGLPGNSILRSYMDYKGRLWFSTYRNGVFYIEDDEIVVPKFNEEIRRRSRDLVRRFIIDFYVDSEDNILLSYGKNIGGIISANIKDTCITFLKLNSIIENESFYYTLKDKGKNIINGIFSSSHFKGEESWLNSKSGFNQLSFGSVIPINSYRTKTKFASLISDNGILEYISINSSLYDPNKSHQIMQFEYDINYIYKLDTNILIGTEGGGIYYFNRSVSKTEIRRNIFNGMIISKIIQDDEGFIWISTVGNGVLIIPSFNAKTGFLNPKKDNLKYKGEINLYNDTLMIAYESKLNYYVINNLSSPFHSLKLPNQIFCSKNIIWDKTRITYLATKCNSELSLYSVNYSSKFSLNPMFNLKKIITYQKGINKIELKNSADSIIFYSTDGFDIIQESNFIYSSTKFFNKDIRCSSKLNSKINLFGTPYGLYSLQDSTYTYLGDEYPELTTSINSLKNDSFGNTLISAQGEGLGIWYKDTLIFLNEKNGLANNFIEKVEVVDSILWVATNNGLNQLKLNKYGRYDIKHLLGKRFIGFDQIDELLINNGKPVVIHDNQVVFVDPDVLKYPFKNDIVLNKIKVNEISIDSNQTKILEFNYDQNNFYFNYRFNSLHQDENPHFKYRLLGNHDHWISTNQKEVLFTNLPPGTYQFEVKVINPLGKWTPNYSLASFIIHPHFTDTLWFKWTVGVMVFVLLIVTFYLTLINHKLKLKKERILLQTSISSLKRQINPHFIFNAMNSVLYYIAKGDKEDSYKFISQFSKLVRNIVYSTDRKRVPINEELIRINDYMQLEEMRYKDKFTWKIDIEDGLDLEIDSLPPMLIQPIVENSIQHGATQVENGKLLILFRRRHNNLVISVIDNGPGIDISKIEQTDLSQSVGLNNVIQRIKLISNFEKKKNSIEILNNSTFPNSNQKGTEVRITIEQ